MWKKTWQQLKLFLQSYNNFSICLVFRSLGVLSICCCCRNRVSIRENTSFYILLGIFLEFCWTDGYSMFNSWKLCDWLLETWFILDAFIKLVLLHQNDYWSGKELFLWGFLDPIENNIILFQTLSVEIVSTNSLTSSQWPQ